MTAAGDVRLRELALEDGVLQVVAEPSHRLMDLRQPPLVADVVGHQIRVSHGLIYRQEALATPRRQVCRDDPNVAGVGGRESRADTPRSLVLWGQRSPMGRLFDAPANWRDRAMKVSGQARLTAARRAYRFGVAGAGAPRPALGA